MESGKNMQLNADGRETIHSASDFLFLSVESFAVRCLPVPWHWHPEVEFIAVQDIPVQIHVPGRTLSAPPGSLVFINSNISHSMRVVEPHERALCHTCQFSGEFIAPPGSCIDLKYCAPVFSCEQLDALVILPDTPEHRHMISLHETAYALSTQPGFLWELRLRDMISQLWQLLAAETRSIWENSAGQSDIRHKRIRRMLDFIRRHYAEQIMLSDIAASADISERECLRCFQTVLDITPFEYITTCRMQQAVQLLTQSSQSVTQIAEACGFSSHSYFCRAFRKSLHISPSEYRRTHK